MDELLRRLGELRRKAQTDALSSSGILLKNLQLMLCRAGTLDASEGVDTGSNIYTPPFGESFYAAKVQGTSSSAGEGWEVWLVDDKLHPVTDPATVGAWKRTLPSRGFNWSDSGGTGRPCMSVANADKNMVWLMEQPRVVDPCGQPVEFDEVSRPLTINLEVSEDGKKVRGQVEAAPNGEWLSPHFIISNKGRKVTRMRLSRNDMEFISAAVEEFPVEMAPEVLSLVMSNTTTDSVSLSWPGKPLRISSKPMETVDAVIFQSVDEERNLTLSTLARVRDFSPELCAAFPLSAYVSVKEDELVLRRVQGADPTDVANALSEHILSTVKTKKMARGLSVSDNSLTLTADLAEHFLYRDLPWLLNNFQVLGSDKLKAYKLSTATPTVNVTLSSGIDFLEGEASIDIGEQKFTLADLLAQYKKNKYVTLSDGNRVIVEDKYIKRLQRIFRTSSARKSDKKVKVSLFDMYELENLLGKQLDAPGLNERREVIRGLASYNSQRLSAPKLRGELRPYQKSGVKWLKYLYDNKLGGCLADDMGLGKTIQTIALLCSIYPAAKKPALIVMPRSLIFNWQEELSKFAPHLKVATYYGTDRNLKEATEAQVILTTYALVRNDIDSLKDVDFQLIVLDESQNIKNLAAQTTQAAWLLKSKHRLAISGTPIENNLDELYSLFRFLDPGMFGTPESFREIYTIPIQRDEDHEAAESLRRKIFPFVLRRLKKDVLTDLPDRMDQTLYVEMTPEHARYYERRRAELQMMVQEAVKAGGIGGSQMILLQAMTELRRLASVPEALTDDAVRSSKLDTLFEQLGGAMENGHKCVVFFNYIAGLEMASDYLTEHGVNHVTMTGATNNRGETVERFQKNPDCRVMLMTLKTGGVGLNLTAADTVFIFEPWWNKAAEEQAINRLHRIGQKAMVSCYSMITKGTIEEKIRQLQEKKSLLVDEIITTDSAGLKNLTAEDIDFIFK